MSGCCCNPTPNDDGEIDPDAPLFVSRHDRVLVHLQDSNVRLDATVLDVTCFGLRLEINRIIRRSSDDEDMPRIPHPSHTKVQWSVPWHNVMLVQAHP